MESSQYWPLNVPRVSSGSLATRSQGLPSPSSRRSCVHSVSLVSIDPRCQAASIPSDSCEQLVPKLRAFGTQTQAGFALLSRPLSCLPHKRRIPGCGDPSAVTQSYPVLIHNPALACLCAGCLEHGGPTQIRPLLPMSFGQHQATPTGAHPKPFA